MIKIFSISLLLFLFIANYASASSMFDNDGNYTGNWKKMTNVQTSSSNRFKNSDYYSSTWYAEQKYRSNNTKYKQTVSSNHNDIVPFRYNTLNYTKERNMKGADGKYRSKCTDIGDASFCY